MYLAQNLRYLREQKGLSQRECAEIFGLSGSAVAMWEQDQRKPDVEMLIRLSEHFGVTLDNLVLKDLKPPIPLYKLSAVGLVRVYETQGRPYLQLVTWADHQRIRNQKSKYPEYTPDCKILMSNDSKRQQKNASDSKCVRNPIQS